MTHPPGVSPDSDVRCGRDGHVPHAMSRPRIRRRTWLAAAGVIVVLAGVAFSMIAPTPGSVRGVEPAVAPEASGTSAGRDAETAGAEPLAPAPPGPGGEAVSAAPAREPVEAPPPNAADFVRVFGRVLGEAARQEAQSQLVTQALFAELRAIAAEREKDPEGYWRRGDEFRARLEQRIQEVVTALPASDSDETRARQEAIGSDVAALLMLLGANEAGDREGSRKAVEQGKRERR